MNLSITKNNFDFPLKVGANSITIFCEKEGIVRKRASLKYNQKLKAQYEWLLEERGGPYPEPLNQGWENGIYFYDMPYYNNFISFYDFIHKNGHNTNWALLKSILVFLENSLYKNCEKIKSVSILKDYVQKKAFGKIDSILEGRPQFASFLKNPHIKINGIRYLNFFLILEKITNSPIAIENLSNFSFGKIHGDLTIENILVQDKKYLILDPNNENLLSSPLLDYSKLYQSLHSGFEFLCDLKDVKWNGDQIFYKDSRSPQYINLFKSLNKYLQDKLSLEEYRSLKFHEAIHFCRLLPYRFELFPSTWMVFYSQAVKLFNEYFEMIE